MKAQTRSAHGTTAQFDGACLPLAGTQPDCESRSGARRVAVVELYTSEGCYSCPPADRWLSGLQARGINANSVVPLAFHAD